MQGTVGELHALLPDPSAQREVWVLTPSNTALVLGSTQSFDAVGAEVVSTSGVGTLPQPVFQAAERLSTRVDEVVKRRSGGTAVLLSPHNSLWVDVVIGRDDLLWEDDVNVAAIWLGHVWAKALCMLGATDVQVCDSYVPGRWGHLVCFASRGPGEVVVEDAKAVGISQRRTRYNARFQCLLYRQWSPEQLLQHLILSPAEVTELQASLNSSVWVVDNAPAEVVRTFLACLPT